jgi:hypothetical protein
VAGFSVPAGAASTGAQTIPAASKNIQQTRNPGLLPGTASIDNCVTGLSLCIKNYRLGYSRCFFLQTTAITISAIFNRMISSRKFRFESRFIVRAIALGAHCAEHHFMRCILSSRFDRKR